MFVLQALIPGGAAWPRLGVITTRKAGKAVARSRMRRLVRECFRLHRRRFARPADVVVVARPDLAAARFAEAEREWLRLCARVGLLSRGREGPGVSPAEAGGKRGEAGRDAGGAQETG